MVRNYEDRRKYRFTMKKIRSNECKTLILKKIKQVVVMYFSLDVELQFCEKKYPAHSTLQELMGVSVEHS